MALKGWQVSEEDKLLWRAWDEEGAVIFLPREASTHLLGSLGRLVFFSLIATPEPHSVEDFHKLLQDRLPDEACATVQESETLLATVIEEFAAIGLVEAV